MCLLASAKMNFIEIMPKIMLVEIICVGVKKSDTVGYSLSVIEARSPTIFMGVG